MSTERVIQDKKKVHPKLQDEEAEKRQYHVGEAAELSGMMMALQDQIGNNAVQELLTQNKENVDLDEETAAQIDQERNKGQSLEKGTRQKMGAAMGHDFSDVRVHNSPEADILAQRLIARAFTTGRDVFFRQGAYDPYSNEGQELLAHELAHVVQQSSEAVGSDVGPMTVNAPGDAYEQDAEATAQAVASPGGERQPAVAGNSTTIARQVEEGQIQKQVEEKPEEKKEEENS